MLAQSSSRPFPNPLAFKTWHSPINAVKVENVAVREHSGEIIALFNALIGRVKSSRYFQNALGGHLEITFFDQDAAVNALSMSGYFVHGTNLRISPLSIPLQRSKRLADDRRNLIEFTHIFSRYGTVTHCVILATVDNSSRRRGFVVMSTHEEAKLAMSSLTRTQLNGHCLDISWAVVQRSGGFLDGGDRAVPLESRPNSRAYSSDSSQDDSDSANSSSTSISNCDKDLASLTPSLTPTPTLLVLNIPSILFSQVQDMHPLFYPFGRIKKLSLIETPSDETTSVLVEYETAAIAQEAKDALHGQFYIDHELLVHYVRHKATPLDFAPVCDSFNSLSDSFPASFALDSFAPQSLLGLRNSHSINNLYQEHNIDDQYFGTRAPPHFSELKFRQRRTLRSNPAIAR
ncbi:hypothetical protein H0H93_001221 [Arthromyces matolae]|nr:hypothetical protein H0H93_001221 [Arthromyces matolae]